MDDMGGIQHDKTHKLQKPFPGCLGKMVNLFDLNTGVAGNRMLMNKPNLNVSSLSRSQSDVSRMRSVGEPTEDRLMVSELGRRTSNRKSNKTPIKMLIAQEVAKDMGPNLNPASVVAKLMGLDTLPMDQSDASAENSNSRGFSQNYSHMPLDYWKQEHVFVGAQKEYGSREYSQQNECEDVYPQSQNNYVRDKSPQKGRYNDNLNEEKMALVCQKFIEAKRLATDDKLRHSKQFQDALEVLSSNKDLFIKFLQEPDSLFSQHVYNLQSIPPPPETKRITVLKPSKIVSNEKFIESEKKNERLMKKATPVGQLSGRSNPVSAPPVWNGKIDDDLSRPTRIVVLKPSPGKSNDIKTVISPHSSPMSPKVCSNEEPYGEQEDEEAKESREVAKAITCQMEENLSSHHQRDETLLSSVFSNGYIGDESSFNNSVNEYATGYMNNSELMSPASRHSWDYTNRFGSPYSLSSFSHVSCSPESSSVCIEAKKRLSERWVMMASNRSCNEQRFSSRRSSTLGEMLALSDENKPVVLRKVDENEDNVDENEDREPKYSMPFVTRKLIEDDGMSCAPGRILRSKSVPASSMNYATRLYIEVSNCEVDKTNFLNEVTKPIRSRLSLKEKISSLFFSRNKKSGKDNKSCVSPSKCDSTSVGMRVHSPGKDADDRAPCDNYIARDEDMSLGLRGMGKVSLQNLVRSERYHSTISPEAELSITKPVVLGSSSENQDQPSPISVLEPLFGEDDQTALELSGNAKPSEQELLIHSSECKLIDKSPPIGSMARTLSWDESSVCFASSFPLQPNLAAEGIKEDEQEWFFFVQTLLSAAGLDSKVQSDTFMIRWHSPESPLDPSLRHKYLDLKFKDMLYEAKQSQMRSTQKLVFDCVNAALVEITGYGSETCQRAIPYDMAHHKLVENDSFTVTDQVWARIKELFSGEFRCQSDCVNSDTVVVERVVKKETVREGWVEDSRLEMDYIRNEIEVKILVELVQEVVVELSS